MGPPNLSRMGPTREGVAPQPRSFATSTPPKVELNVQHLHLKRFEPASLTVNSHAALARLSRTRVDAGTSWTETVTGTVDLRPGPDRLDSTQSGPLPSAARPAVGRGRDGS